MQPKPIGPIWSEGLQNLQISIITRPSKQMQKVHDPITVSNNLGKQSHRDSKIGNAEIVPAPPKFGGPRYGSQPSREPYLPREPAKGHIYTLVLDLDETLVHFDPRSRTYKPRPGVIKFLYEMHRCFELVVFTAGLKDYADWILNDLDKSGFISHRLYRDHTKHKNGVYIKDLSKLGRNMSKIIIIDNIEDNFQSQPENGIPIKGWYNDPNDRELEKYMNFLKPMVQRKVKDVRLELVGFKKQMAREIRIQEQLQYRNHGYGMR